MNLNKIKEELDTLQEQYEASKTDTRFEKSKLYNYLGELTDTFKKHEVIVAGGMITSLFTSNEINDVDVYFRNKESVAAFIQDIWDDSIYIAAHTKKATLFTYGDIKVQAIHFDYFDNVEEVFNAFDFTICMGAYDFKTEKFSMHKDFMKHNAQKILKFNSSTNYPLVSLLRNGKYQDRGYTISKTELMRIALTCMTLNINSYEELKDHLGGMYGVNYEKIIEENEDDEFNLVDIIEKLKDLSVSEDYFNEPEPIKFNDVEELISSICDLKIKYFETDSGKFKVSYDGSYVDQFYSDVTENMEKIDANKFFKDKKFYKFVRKVDDKYFSYYDKSFEYKVGEEISTTNGHGLYFNLLEDIRHSSYRDRNDKVLIEVIVDGNDLKEEGTNWKFKKCEVVRQVPAEEWEKYLNEGNGLF